MWLRLAIGAGVILYGAAGPATAQVVYTWTGADYPGHWLSPANWTPSANYPGLSTAAGAGNPNDLAQFISGTTYPYPYDVGIDLNATNTSLALGAVSVTGTTTLTIGNSTETPNLTNRNLILNGAVAGNTAGLAAGTLLSTTGGDLTLQPTVGTGVSPLGVVLGTDSGIISVVAGKRVTITCVVSDAGTNRGFTVQGGGLVVLSGANTFGGRITVTGAGTTLLVSSDANLGAAPSAPTAGQIVLDGGRLLFDNRQDAVSVNANRGIAVGPALGAGGGTIDADSTSATAPITYAGVIANNGSGVGSMIKDGFGQLVLQGANTYSGGTTVVRGTLFANHTSGSGTGTGGVSIDGYSASLRGTGTIAPAAGNSVTVANGGIGGGDASGVGSLRINSDLTINAALSYSFGTIQVFTGRPTGHNETTASLIDLSGGMGTLHLNPTGGKIWIDIETPGNVRLLLGESYTLTLVTVGTADNFRLNGAMISRETPISLSNYALWSVQYGFSNPSLFVDSTGQNLNVTFTVQPVPEPCSVVLIATIGLGFGAAGRYRPRSPRHGISRPA